ncbi:flippase [Sulfurovum sp.]|uniref:flippase n=1 Tax=Sulfurovum sp. TaxID=1969726 RepID=UPI0035681C70
MRYFQNTSWLFGEKILRMALGLFIGIWIARYLGPEQFGLFSYAISFVGLFTVIATLGLDGIVIRELVKDERRRDELIGTAFFLKLTGAFLVLLILAIAINVTSNDHFTNTLIFIIASATIFQSFNIIDFYFQSKVLSKYVVYANIISLFSSSLIKIVLILNEAPLIAFAWVVLFDSFVLACGLVYFFLKNSDFSFKNLKFKKPLATDLLLDSWPLILSGIASVINMRIDQVMLGNMTNFGIVGNYAAAIKISELWLIIPVVISASIYPAIISAKQQSHPVYKHRIVKTVTYMASFAIPFALIVSCLSGMIVELLYGDKYFNATSYLAILIWSGVPYITLFVYTQVAMIEKLTKVSLYTSIYAIVVNLSLNYIYIPIYGGTGAAMTTLFVAWSSVLLNVYLIEKKANILNR